MSDAPQATKIYGLAEIAHECGVSIYLARKWQQRGKLPAPTAKLVQGFVWTGPEIEAFLQSRPGPPPAGPDVLGTSASSSVVDGLTTPANPNFRIK